LTLDERFDIMINVAGICGNKRCNALYEQTSIGLYAHVHKNLNDYFENTAYNFMSLHFRFLDGMEY
jgi:hypothetical protein